MALSSDTITIDQGTTWAVAWTYMEATVASDGTEGDPVAPDWTGWSGRSQVRAVLGAADALCTWSSDPDEVAAGTANGLLTLASGGVVTLSLTPAASTAMTWFRRGACPWQVELTNPAGQVIRLLEGTCELRAETTLDA